MSGPLANELDVALARLRSEHDILPFIQQLLRADQARLAPLPDDMMAVLVSSPDFARIRPGEPVWISLAASPDASAEIVIYRAEADRRHYVIAPAKD